MTIDHPWWWHGREFGTYFAPTVYLPMTPPCSEPSALLEPETLRAVQRAAQGLLEASEPVYVARTWARSVRKNHER